MFAIHIGAVWEVWKLVLPVCILVVLNGIFADWWYHRRLQRNLDRVIPKSTSYPLFLYCFTFLWIPLLGFYFFVKPPLRFFEGAGFNQSLQMIALGFCFPTFIALNRTIRYITVKESKRGSLNPGHFYLRKRLQGRSLVTVLVLFTGTAFGLILETKTPPGRAVIICLLVEFFLFVPLLSGLNLGKVTTIAQDDNLLSTPLFSQLTKMLSHYTKKTPRISISHLGIDTAKLSQKLSLNDLITFFSVSGKPNDFSVPSALVMYFHADGLLVTSAVNIAQKFQLSSKPFYKRYFHTLMFACSLMLIFLILLLAVSGVSTVGGLSIISVVNTLWPICAASFFLGAADLLLRMLLHKQVTYKEAYMIWSESETDITKPSPADFVAALAKFDVVHDYVLSAKTLKLRYYSNRPLIKWLLDYGPETKAEAMQAAQQVFAEREKYMPEPTKW